MSDKVSCTHCDRSYDVDFSKSSSIMCFCGKHIRFSEIPSQPLDPYIRFLCPSCSKPYKVLVEKAGQKRTCPSCSKPFTIPSHSTPKPDQEQPKLIDCPDCGTSISRLAAACPKCGRPNESNEKAIFKNLTDPSKITLIIFIVVLLVGGFAAVVSSAKKSNNSKEFAKQQLLRDLQDNLRNTKAATRNAQDFLYGKGNSKPVDVRVVE